MPGILTANPCVHLALEATVVRKMGLFQRVQPYAVCTAKLVELDDPTTCWKGCEFFTPRRVAGDALLASVDETAPDR